MPFKLLGTPKPVNVTGCLFPWYPDTNQPVLVGDLLNPNEQLALPIFTTPERLAMALTWIKPPRETTVKQIQNGQEFYDSVKDHVLVIIDPYQKDGGKIGFTGLIPYPETDPRLK